MNKDHIINIQGKDFVTWEGLLNEAHGKGLSRIQTTIIQVPSPDNGQTCIVVAEVEVTKGVFTGIGDANPNNVKKHMVGALIRLAETRAKARALRDAVNIGTTALEELGETDDTPQQQTQPNGRRVDQNTGEILEPDNPFDGQGVHNQNQDPSPTLALAKDELKKALNGYEAFHHVGRKDAYQAVFAQIRVPEKGSDWTVQHYTSLTIWLRSNSRPEPAQEPEREVMEV